MSFSISTEDLIKLISLATAVKELDKKEPEVILKVRLHP
jgi:hypothetical protein